MQGEETEEIEGKMQQRPLGSQGLVCSQQGLGCMTMTAFYGKFNRKESENQSIEAIGKALEMGVNMLGNAIMLITD